MGAALVIIGCFWFMVMMVEESGWSTSAFERE